MKCSVRWTPKSFLRQVIDRDVVGAIRTVDNLVDEGRELGQLVNDFTWYMRNLLLIQSADDMEEVLDMSEEHLAALREEAAMVSQETLIRYIRIFSELGNQIKFASQKRILLEIAIIKLCKPQMEQDYSSLLERMDELEHKIETGTVAAVPASSVESMPRKAQTPIEKPALPKAVFDDANAYSYLNEDKAGCMSMFRELLEERTGKKMEVVLHMNESGRSAVETVPDLREIINFDIEEENF